MSLTDNTTELEEVLTLANSIEVPTIKSISVNGVAQTPDENKNVDLTIPSIDGLSTEEYVDNAIANIEIPEVPIKSISVGGVTQSPDTNGNVDLTIESGGASLYQHDIQIIFWDPGAFVWGVAYCTVYSDISTEVTNQITMSSLMGTTTDGSYNIQATGAYLPSGPGANSTPASITKLKYIDGGGDFGLGQYVIYTADSFPTNSDYSGLWDNWNMPTHDGYYGWEYSDKVTQIL